VAAALFDVRVKRMYEKELYRDRGRRSLVSIVMAQRAASESQSEQRRHNRPKKAFGRALRCSGISVNPNRLRGAGDEPQSGQLRMADLAYGRDPHFQVVHLSWWTGYM
jgi:hypothetical protein